MATGDVPEQDVVVQTYDVTAGGLHQRKLRPEELAQHRADATYYQALRADEDHARDARQVAGLRRADALVVLQNAARTDPVIAALLTYLGVPGR